MEENTIKINIKYLDEQYKGLPVNISDEGFFRKAARELTEKYFESKAERPSLSKEKIVSTLLINMYVDFLKYQEKEVISTRDAKTLENILNNIEKN